MKVSLSAKSLRFVDASASSADAQWECYESRLNYFALWKSVKAFWTIAG